MAKHNLKLFNQAVSTYKKVFRGLNGSALVFGSLGTRDAFFSLAPLSKALHDLGLDVHINICSRRSESNIPLLMRIWKAYGARGNEYLLLREFIDYVEKKSDGVGFSKIFERPDVILELRQGAILFNGKKLPLYAKWFRRYDGYMLKETCKRIIKDCYALKKTERFSIGFELVPSKKMLELPLEDYLDNFAIAYHMAAEAKRFCKAVVLSASTARESKLDFPEKISELSATLAGCEYEKNIKGKPFEIFKRLSKSLGLNRWKRSSASFNIVGKGYHGRHIFGLAIGYPTPNRKTRWSSPTQMFLKPWWYEQAKLDKRKPKTRLAITETLPLEEFTQTCNIDYAALRRRDAKIKRIIENSVRLEVESDTTNLVVELGSGKKKRLIQRSDSDVRKLIDRDVLKRYNILAGVYDNIPGGEVFFTPENIRGTAVGDVVINIDRSYVLNAKRPIVVKFAAGKWKIVKAPKNIIEKISQELKDVKKLIKKYEQNRSLPKRIVDSYRKNFKRVGEFAINTNPKAKLSRYLIVNEKLANMMHIALGSGFEPDRQTLYHWDFVIDIPRQKISIKAIDSKGNKQYIIKDGRFVL